MLSHNAAGVSSASQSEASERGSRPQLIGCLEKFFKYFHNAFLVEVLIFEKSIIHSECFSSVRYLCRSHLRSGSNCHFIKILSVNNVYSQIHFSECDDGCSQVVERDKAAVKFFVSHE